MNEDLPAAGIASGRLPNELSQDVTSFDSSAVFLVKALFYPVTTIAFFILCLWLAKRPFSGAHFLIAVLTFAGAAEFLGDSRVDRDAPALQEARWLLEIVLRWVALCACVALVVYLSGLKVAFTDRVLVVWFLLTPVVLWSGAIKVRQLLLYVGVKRNRPRTAVIIGVNEQALHLSKMIRAQPLLGIQILGFFEDRHAQRLPHHGQRLLGRMDDAAAFVSQWGVNIVYITLPISPRPSVLKLLRALRNTVASVYFVPAIHAALQNIQARVDVVHGIPMIAIYASPFFGARSLAKRASDIALSALALLCLSPVLITVAICVKLTSEGPILFRQRRYGLDGREIMVYKFRSMTVTEDGATQYTQVTRGDSRVTPFGAFIRRTSLDELPQLLNVLEGTMSLVGPRPHAVAVNEHYRSLIPSYMLRHKVKPGITGWAQVNGFRGGDDLLTMSRRIEFDLAYLENWSIWFDLRIILRTLSVIWSDRDAY